MVYEVVYCNECMKPIKSIPTWLSDVKVRFTCEACRQKHPKAAAGYETVGASRAAREDEVIEDPDLLGAAADDEDSADDSMIDPDVPLDETPDEP